MKHLIYLLLVRDVLNLAALSLLAWIRHSLLALLARVAIAMVFLQSGRSKVDGWLTLKDSTYSLLREQLALLPPDLVAPVIVYTEHLFAALLIVGFLTRFSAIALLALTLMTQVLLMPAAWLSHLTWAALLLFIIGRGAGRISLDHALGLH